MTLIREWQDTSSQIVLQEYIDSKLATETLEEDRGAGKQAVYKLKGIFQRGDSPNGNRRVYPTLILEREISRLKPLVAKRRIVGELDHPANRDKPKMSEASHVITFLEMRGKEVYGELEIIPGTTQGNNLLGLYRAGVEICVSSRGTGGLRALPNGLFEVDDSLQINTWDIVSEPSVADAILHEGMMLNQKLIKSKKSAVYYFDKALFS